MKAFLWVVLLGILGVCFYYILLSMKPDESRMIAIAFGNSTDDAVEMHVEMSMMMADMDVYPYMDEAGGTDWARWAKDHYVVVDDAGNQVEFARRMKSSLISERDTRGLEGGFLVGTVPKDTHFTFTYIPVVGEPEKFQYELTSPTEDTGRTRFSFQPVQ